MAAAALAVCAIPASASAQPGQTAEKNAKTQIRDGSHRAARSPRSRADGRSITPALSGKVLLALGAGYNGAAGSPLVKALQLRLARAGDRPGPIDGRYGPLTEQAVRRLQAAHGLAVDGIAGPVTVAALTSPTPVLYPGAGIGQAGGSASVRSLQRRLAGLGFSPGPLDGRYGPLTTRAVERFQRLHGLKADGLVGILTGRALRAAGRDVRSVLRRRRRRPLSRPISNRPHAPRSTAPRVTGAVGHSPHSPALPVVLVLLGMAAMGLGTGVVSYERTRTKVRRASESTLLRAMEPKPPKSPPDSQKPDRPLVGVTEERDR